MLRNLISIINRGYPRLALSSTATQSCVTFRDLIFFNTLLRSPTILIVPSYYDDRIIIKSLINCLFHTLLFQIMCCRHPLNAINIWLLIITEHTLRCSHSQRISLIPQANVRLFFYCQYGKT